MKKVQNGTVVGVFQNREQAQQAIRELKQAGYTDDQIGVLARDTEGWADKYAKEKGSYAEEGAVAGVATGAGVAALWSLGITFGVLPVVGPILAAGPIAAALLSAAGGAAAGGILGGLIGMGIPEEEASYYEDEFKQGRIIVTVKDAKRRDDATAVMHRFGGYDMRTRGTSQTAATGTAARTSTTTGEKNIQLREEQMQVHKQPTTTGEVRVRKEVHTEHRTIDVPVHKEEVVVERRPASGRAATGGNIQEGQEIRIPVQEEQVHVEKHPVVKEEVSVKKRTVQDTKKISGTVRKEELQVEKQGDVEVRDDTKGRRRK